ncbi:MAG: PD-(D/E)XK nuclease family protein [Candidatus Aenigmarchaeota archaeon]|nr:PD-(D/E)XK nuclease family protein [Candidatus Aenigmarchaeota archaeon]
MQYKLSPHSLNQYNECHRCFYQNVKEKKARPKGHFPSLPSGMDLVIKKHFDEYRGTNQLPPELRNLHDLEGTVLFDNKKLLSEWRNQWKGLFWKDAKGNILHGALDDVLIKDDNLIVMDYKTRGFPLKEKPTYYQLQLDVYDFLLQKNNHPAADYAFLLFYYPVRLMKTENVLFKFNTELVKMNVDAGNAQKTFADAVTILEGAKPKKNEKCEFCQFSVFAR